MRRVVILSCFLTPLRSGAEACAEEVALRLSNEYDITIVTARMSRDLKKHDFLNGKVPVIRVGFGFGFDKWLYPFIAPLVARKLNPDLIHAVLETFAGLALHFCKWIVPRANRLLTCQTTNRSFLKKMVVRSPDTVTAISSALIKIIEECGRNDVVHIPNGIPVAVIRKSLQTHEKIPGRILFVGRLESMKGIDTLLHVFEKVLADVPEAHLRIVGDGSQRQNLEKISQDLGISDQVIFAGHIDPHEVHREFAQAQIFCGLSRSEALGNVFLEAQAAGCAVVGTLVGGIPDIVKDGETGTLVSSDDTDAAANALLDLLSHPEKVKAFSHAGVLNASQYDWDHIAQRYLSVYQTII
jgi:glycosyltransferase involved in cell wall biosynthesis